MILLPRGTPLKEKLVPLRINLPDAFGKLRSGRFTGYLRFDSPQSTGIVIFEDGRLISSLCESTGESLVGPEALAGIFQHSQQEDASLDVYRLSAELARGIHSLLHGNVLYRGQELKLIDIRSLLTKMKDERITGCLRIYTDEHIALIFYRRGNPLGFFHDGSTDIETTADTSMSVARLPGAKVDVLAAREAADMVLADLAESADLPALWRKAREQAARRHRMEEEETVRSRERAEWERRRQILLFLQAAAERHLGKIGAPLVEKEFEKLLLGEGRVSETAFTPLFERLARSAKLVAGPSAVNLMLEEMKKGVRLQLQQS